MSYDEIQDEQMLYIYYAVRVSDPTKRFDGFSRIHFALMVKHQ